MSSFKGYKRTIKLEFDYDEIKNGVPNAKKQMAILNAEFKKSGAEAEASGKEIDKLGTKYDFLSNKIKIQEQEVEKYRQNLDKATNAKGNNTKAIENNTASLQIAEAKLAQTRAELDKVAQSVEYQQSVLDKSTGEWKELEYQLDLVNAQYAKTSTEADASGKSVNKLSSEHKMLTDTFKIQEKQVEILKDKLNEASQSENRNEEAVKANTLELVKAEGQLVKTKQELDRVTQELDKQKLTLGKTGDEWKELSEKTSEIGKTMSTKFTVPLLAAAGASFKLGADYEDALGKATTVFGNNKKSVEEWAKTSLDNFGLARSTALAMATDFAAGFNQLGISMDKSTEWSKNLAEKTNDLATFYNYTVEETQSALNAILSGQTEPLKKFNIFMTQASLQTYAYESGIRKKISAMTEAEKVQLRYNYVMDKTSQAHGNFKREQDGATAQMTLFKEGLKELGVSFSEQILPIFTPVLTGINGMIKGFAGLNEGTKKFIVVVGGIVAAVGPVLIILGSVFKAISNINQGIGAIPKIIDGAGKAGKAFSGLLNNTAFMGFAKWALAIIGVVLAITALIVAINYLIGRGREMNEFSKNMSNTVTDIGNTIGNAQNKGMSYGTGYINGSHRDGISYVPRDGYLAELHEGERVLTKEENLKRADSGNTYIMQVKLEEVDEVYKLVKVFENFKGVKRGGVVNA